MSTVWLLIGFIAYTIREIFMDNVKGLLKSKVFWFNAVTGTLEIVNLLAPLLPPGTMTVVNVIGNVLLRFVTSEPLSAKVNK